MKSISELTGKMYENEDVVFFRNLYQCAFYVAHNVMPVDMFTDNNGKLVMVFDRQQHNKIIKLWVDNKDKNKEENN